MKLSLSQLFILAMARLSVVRAACDCETIDSFENLKELLENSTTEGEIVRLCPFHITKSNSEEGIFLNKGMHIMCAKESREDECKIEGVGVVTSYNTALEVFIATNGVDNLSIQGLTFSSVKRGAIRVKGNNFQLIDCVFENSQSPVAISGAIVDILSGSSASIVDSKFIANEGGAVQNQGVLTVSHCDFLDNASTPVWISNDETDNRGGGTGGAILNAEDATLFVFSSTFVSNCSDENGPAIWSHTNSAIDLGENCGKNNRIVHLQSDPEIISGFCDGIYYKTTSSGDSICATFGSECKM